MLCSMCPKVLLSDVHAPGKGWQCECQEVHCSHVLNCDKCGANRYQLEKVGKLRKGKIVKRRKS